MSLISIFDILAWKVRHSFPSTLCSIALDCFVSAETGNNLDNDALPFLLRVYEDKKSLGQKDCYLNCLFCLSLLLFPAYSRFYPPLPLQ